MPEPTSSPTRQEFGLYSTHHISLLSITGADPQMPVVRLMIESCDAYLPKPFAVPALLTAVNRLLQMPYRDNK